MAIPTATLARGVSFADVLPLLDVTVPSSDLPTIVDCPLCKETGLWIFLDQALHAQWACCDQCQFAGDPFELAARVWQADIPATLCGLEYAGLSLPDRASDPGAVADYLRDHIQSRQRIVNFWARVQSDLPLLEPHSLTRWQRNIQPSTDHNCWSDRGRRTIGYCTIQDVEYLFHPGSLQPRLRKNRNGKESLRLGSGAGNRRIFKGSGEDHVFVMPVEDLPGRIGGFIFIRDVPDIGPADVVFKKVTALSLGQQKESGLVMLANALGAHHPDLGNTLIIIPDAVLAIRIQLRWLRENTTRLPIVAPFEDDQYKCRDVWRHLPAGRRVLWSPHVGPREIVLARLADARVSTFKATAEQILNNPLLHLYGLSNIRKSTISWQDALREQLNQLSLPAAEKLLREINLDPMAMRKFFKKCSQSLLDKLQPLLAKEEFLTQIDFRGRRIVERDGGLFLSPSGEEICNSQFRIDERLQTRQGDVYLRGRCQVHGEPVPFLVNSATINAKGLLASVQEQLPAESAAELRCLPRYARDLEKLAHLFSEDEFPNTVNEADVVGYYDCRFHFPQFALDLRGRVLPGKGAVLAGPNAPATNLAPPQPLSNYALSRLSRKSRETRLFWAVTAGIIHNLLAPLMDDRPAGIALVGQGAQTIGHEAALLLGCREFRIPPRRSTLQVLGHLQKVCAEHNWPILLTPATKKSVRFQLPWVVSYGSNNCLMPLERENVELAISLDWLIVRSERHVETLRSLSLIAPRILPLYLQDLFRRRCNCWWKTACPVQNILNDIAEWFAGLGGDREAVLRALHVMKAKLLPSPQRKPLPQRSHQRKRERPSAGSRR
jgi:hypothetical protein